MAVRRAAFFFALAFATTLVLPGAGAPAQPPLEDGDVEVVWVNKVPTARFKPDLKDIKREKNECFCLILLVGKANSLVLNEEKVNTVGDEYVGWNAPLRSGVYFSRVKESGGLFEGMQWIVFDDEKRLLAHGRTIDVPLVGPPGNVTYETTATTASVVIQTPAKKGKLDVPAGAKVDLASFGPRAKVYATVATFPLPTKAGKVTRDPKAPQEATHAYRRASWEPFRMSLASVASTATFDTTPPGK